MMPIPQHQVKPEHQLVFVASQDGWCKAPQFYLSNNEGMFICLVRTCLFHHWEILTLQTEPTVTHNKNLLSAPAHKIKLMLGAASWADRCSCCSPTRKHLHTWRKQEQMDHFFYRKARHSCKGCTNLCTLLKLVLPTCQRCKSTPY